MKITAPTCCPSCGSQLNHDRPVVDLASNTIAFGDGIAQLTAKQAEIVAALAMSSPAAIAFERLIARVWGGQDGPEDPRGALKVQVCLTRPKLAPLGLGIVSVHGSGMALRKLAT